ncbi:hypothetical protein EJB05_37011, partial [Eragrostis curvula]
MPDRREEDGTPAAVTGGGEDRISALPDDLLHLVLSRRRRQWTVETLHNFVNHLLLLRGGTPADVCLLSCCELRGDPGYDEQHYEYQQEHLHRQLSVSAELWIRTVLTVCRVRELEVSVRTYRRLRLYKSPFVSSQVLRRLDLTDVSLMFSCWRDQSMSFHPLDFSSCPALKDLTMSSCKIHVSAIVSKTLRWLSITECHFHSDFRTRVSTPRVVWMELSVCSGRAPILDNMPKLEEAYLRLENEYYDHCQNDDYHGDCKDGKCRGCLGSSDGNNVLLQSLSPATDLELMSDPRKYIFLKDSTSCAIFRKLKTLVLNDWCMGAELGGLVFFLRYSPVLKKLTLQLEYCEALGRGIRPFVFELWH